MVSSKAADALHPIAGAEHVRDEARVLLDEAAFTTAYRSTAGPLRAYAARVLGSVAAADDIVQETYLRVLRTPLPAMDAAALRSYVFQVATHIMTDQFRRQQRERRAIFESASVDASHDPALAVDMARFFARLRPRDRQLLWLAHVEGFDHREIALTFGLRQGSVRVLLSRARQRLAAMLRGAPGSGEAR